MRIGTGRDLAEDLQRSWVDDRQCEVALRQHQQSPGSRSSPDLLVNSERGRDSRLLLLGGGVRSGVQGGRPRGFAGMATRTIAQGRSGTSGFQRSSRIAHAVFQDGTLRGSAGHGSILLNRAMSTDGSNRRVGDPFAVRRRVGRRVEPRAI
jgi:hypothetical protein